MFIIFILVTILEVTKIKRCITGIGGNIEKIDYRNGWLHDADGVVLKVVEKQQVAHFGFVLVRPPGRLNAERAKRQGLILVLFVLRVNVDCGRAPSRLTIGPRRVPNQKKNSYENWELFTLFFINFMDFKNFKLYNILIENYAERLESYHLSTNSTEWTSSGSWPTPCTGVDGTATPFLYLSVCDTWKRVCYVDRSIFS